MMHETFGLVWIEIVQSLYIARAPQRGDGEDLGLAALE
jgi:hypothetical protein